MGSAKAEDAAYTAMFDRVAGMDGGLDFLREHARRAGNVGQDQLAGALAEMRRLFEEQAVLMRSANRAEVLRHELQEMAATIEQARREVRALQPQNAENNRLIIATSELDAIVTTTERASFDILQSAERLMELVGKARRAGAAADLCDEMETVVTDIFTACSFQDLTGQRTSKVVGALRYVEQRVLAMMNLWSGEMAGADVPVGVGQTDTRPDAHLLSGPSSQGVSQDDVDALLNGTSPPPKPAAAPDTSTAGSGAPARRASASGDGAAPIPLDQSAIDNLFE